MIYAQFLLISFGCMLAWFELAHSPREIRPNGYYYFQMRAEDRNPFQASRILSPFQARLRSNYYRAFIDESGRLSYFEIYVHGHKQGGEQILYAEGRVKTRVIWDSNGRQRLVRYP